MPERRIQEFVSLGQQTKADLFLSVEERLCLEVSLRKLKIENRFQSVSLQAKFYGLQGDYYVACGKGDDYLRNKMFFYSVDGYAWRFLAPPAETDMKHVREARYIFTGDPTYVQRFQTGNDKVAFREENRLSASVHLLEWETEVGPKEALQVNPQGKVQKNPYFKGIENADDIGSYVHFRLPRSPSAGLLPSDSLCPAAGDCALNFLEPITMDYPSGCWMLRRDPVKCCIRLSNLWWPGHVFHACPQSGDFSSIYVGNGIRNDDLPFMI